MPGGVLVDEDQPSSLIAYTLASAEHAEFISNPVSAADLEDGTTDATVDEKTRKYSGNDVHDGAAGDKSPSKSQRRLKPKDELMKHHFQV